jgi:hypothetical protein
MCGESEQLPEGGRGSLLSYKNFYYTPLVTWHEDDMSPFLLGLSQYFLGF